MAVWAVGLASSNQEDMSLEPGATRQDVWTEPSAVSVKEGLQKPDVWDVKGPKSQQMSK